MIEYFFSGKMTWEEIGFIGMIMVSGYGIGIIVQMLVLDFLDEITSEPEEDQNDFINNLKNKKQ